MHNLQVEVLTKEISSNLTKSWPGRRGLDGILDLRDGSVQSGRVGMLCLLLGIFPGLVRYGEGSSGCRDHCWGCGSHLGRTGGSDLIMSSLTFSPCLHCLSSPHVCVEIWSFCCCLGWLVLLPSLPSFTCLLISIGGHGFQ